VWWWKNCENRLAFRRVTGKNKVAPFFRTRCIVNISNFHETPQTWQHFWMGSPLKRDIHEKLHFRRSLEGSRIFFFWGGGRNSKIAVNRFLRLLSLYACAVMQADIAQHESMLSFHRKRITQKMPKFTHICDSPPGGRERASRLWHKVSLAPRTACNGTRRHCDTARSVVGTSKQSSRVASKADCVHAVHSADTAVAYVFTHRCTWRRRDAQVRKTFVFLSIIFKLLMLCIRTFCHDLNLNEYTVACNEWNSVACNTTKRRLFCFTCVN